MFQDSDKTIRRAVMEAQAKSDGLRLLRAIDPTQAHGQEGTRVDPAKVAHEAGLDAGDVSAPIVTTTPCTTSSMRPPC
jgi:hypothetical protein